MTLTFSVPGTPPSVNRLLAAARHIPGKNGGRGFVQHFTPKPHKGWHCEVWGAFKAAYPGRAPLAGRLRVTIAIRFPTKRASDIDNYAKAALDALAHAGAIVDDSQVDELTLTRLPSDGRAQALTRYEIEELSL